METVEVIQNINIIRNILADDGVFPNNALLPLIIYQKAVNAEKSSAQILELLETNGWVNGWENGIYDYHHYHSTAHEVLVVKEGSARVQFGGPSGVSFLLEKGDVILIPAGVAHKALDIYDEFSCIGAYPTGQDYDILKGEPGDREKALENIKSLPLPVADPVYGNEGPLTSDWK